MPLNCDLFFLDRGVEKISNQGEFTIKHISYWTIYDFKWLLNNQTNREICTNNSKIHQLGANGGSGNDEIDTEDSSDESDENDNAVTDVVFDAKIELIGHENDLVEIYYRASETLIVQPICNVEVQKCQYSSYVVYSSDTKTSRGKYQVVPKNQWQFITVLSKINLWHDLFFVDWLLIKFSFLVPSKNNYVLLQQIQNEKGGNIFDVPNDNETMLSKYKYKELLPKTKLVSDLSRLLKDNTFYDVTVKSIEGEEFRAHKIILGTRSPVLRAHFAHNTVETKTNVIECPFESSVVKELLTYIYTEDTPNINKIPRKLLRMADYYQIDELKNLCGSVLERKLTVKNAMEILECAYLYRLNNLERKTLEFIKDVAAKDIAETKGWKESKSADLIKKVYDSVVNNKFV